MIPSRMMVQSLGVMAWLALGACTHVKGQVLEDRTRLPVTEAVFTVGRPDSVGTYARYKVDGQGRFDFRISATDENYLFLWDGKGDPLTDVRRVEPGELSDHMTIVLPMRRGGGF